MMFEIARVSHSQERVEESAVAYVDLRGLHLAFSQVFNPRGAPPRAMRAACLPLNQKASASTMHDFLGSITRPVRSLSTLPRGRCKR